MNLASAIKKVKRLVPKRFRKPTLMEQRADLKALKLKVLGEDFFALAEIEDTIKTKGKTSKEVSIVKSKVALDFSKKHFGIKLTPEQQQKIAELMARLEYRENAVKSVKRNALSDEMANKIRKELISQFPNKKDYINFLTTYRIYTSKLRQVLKKAGY